MHMEQNIGLTQCESEKNSMYLFNLRTEIGLKIDNMTFSPSYQYQLKYIIFY